MLAHVNVDVYEAAWYWPRISSSGGSQFHRLTGHPGHLRHMLARIEAGTG